MSAISTYLEYIRTKIYAKDVRTAIVNAISQCYDDVNAPALQTEAMQAAVQAKIDSGEMAALTIADGTITGAKLVDGTIPTVKIADGAVTGAKLANGTITAGKIASGVIPAVDATLTQPGVPADAKAVGDLIYPAVESRTEELTTIADTPVLTWAQGNIGSSGSINTSNTQWIYSSVVDTTGLSGFTAEFRASQGYRYVVYFYYSDGTGERISTRTAASDPFTKDLTGVDGFRISSSPSPVAAISPSVGDDTITYIMSKTETVVEVQDIVAGIKTLARAEAEDVVDEHEKTHDAITPCLSVFPTFAVIGDSYSSGAIHFPDGGYVRRYDLSWCQQMARHFGGVCTNYTYSGIGTRGWLTDATYGLPKLLSDDPKDLYILALGINDYTQIVNGTLTLGTVEDMVSDYTQSPDSFYGNYNRIIGNIKAHAPNARIVQLSYLRPTGGGKNMLNPAFEDIADKAGIPLVYLEDDAFFTSDFYRVATQVDGHPTAVGYAGMCTAIERLLSKCVEDNPSYFGQIGHV